MGWTVAVDLISPLIHIHDPPQWQFSIILPIFQHLPRPLSQEVPKGSNFSESYVSRRLCLRLLNDLWIDRTFELASSKYRELSSLTHLIVCEGVPIKQGSVTCTSKNLSLIGLFKYPYGSYLHINFLGPIKIMVGKVRGNFDGAQKISLKIWRFEPYGLTKIYLNCPRIELQRVLCESNLDLN